MPVLSLRKISKNFGAIRALTDVDLDLDPGEVLGLMGDNGAGKSTLVKIVAGNFPPTAGEIMGGDPGVASCGVTSTGCAVSGIARVGGDPAAGPSESAFAVGAIGVD